MAAGDISSQDLLSGNRAIDDRLNLPQVLSLIDSILPFEACLYHEIIPLAVEASCLHLGMVDPQDAAALGYARKQAAFIHCSVVSWPVPSDWQRKLLSKYLNHSARHRSAPVVTPPPPAPSREELLTFIVDSPERLDEGSPPQPVPLVTADRRPASGTAKIPPDYRPLASPKPASQPLDLSIDPVLTQLAGDRLRNLPARQLAQALLSQALAGGIGRLYIERHANCGKVLWSKDGALQSMLPNLSPDQLTALIQEFKRLVHLPLLSQSTQKQADIERLYQGERVLLRLRLIAGTHGEEATLQVLRGAALRFYQQQQMRQMGEDALGVAKALQQRISQIRDRTRQSLVAESPPAQTLESLSALLKSMEAQVDQIIRSAEIKE